MFLASYLLAAMAVILAWPAPILLSRARWTARSPGTALVLWQAIALAGGLSMIGAMLTWGLEPLGEHLLAGLRGLTGLLLDDSADSGLDLVHVFALSAALLLTVHLVFTLLLTYYKIRKQRGRHRDLLNLLSSPSEDSPRTLVINHPAPVAYCLPGGGGSVTVLSNGLLELLSPDELHAVMTHEKAHLEQRHDLLLWAFAAWRAALPWLPTSKLARTAVNELIEMLADDHALKTSARETLVRAIAVVAAGERPATAGPGAGLGDPAKGLLGAAEAESFVTAHRLRRLLSPVPALSGAARSAVLLAAALLLAVPTVLLVAPGLAA